MKKVYVGMSGGVDSSVSALLLKQQGFDVVGVFMKNWTADIGQFDCPWEQDLVDADSVAAQIGIELKVFDFQKQYRRVVVDYMIEGYKSGQTPNPDIMCNQEIKFKLFLDSALEDGADMIATGHYAKIADGQLFRAKDKSKDQSYFLARVEATALKKTIFPLGDLTKKQVRKIALDNNLITASKKDSVGICFVGQVGIKDFLGEFIKTKPGPIIDQNGKEVGEHDGAVYYTIGQRHGLGVGGGLPYYVTKKDVVKNIVYVTTDLDDEALWSDELNLEEIHWMGEPLKQNQTTEVMARYQAKLAPAIITKISKTSLKLKLKNPLKAVAPGQTAVMYDGERVAGSGVISDI